MTYADRSLFDGAWIEKSAVYEGIEAFPTEAEILDAVLSVLRRTVAGLHLDNFTGGRSGAWSRNTNPAMPGST